jgi:competence protein ComEC
MTAVVLIAVLVDRRAVTVRTLAVAALVVLAIAPEALVHPSFQRSMRRDDRSSETSKKPA